MSKYSVGIRIDPALAERMDHVRSDMNDDSTFTELVRANLEKEVAKLESLNGGKPFPPRTSRREAVERALPRKSKKPPR
jgi:hypothetical protein